MTTKTPRVGGHILVMVPRSSNGGLDHAPATITRVYPNGTVNLHALVDVGEPVRITRATLVADRAAALAILDEHFSHLPGGAAVEDDNGDLVQGPGHNSMTGDPWHRSDVAHWHKVAYWDAVDAPAAAPVESQAAASVESQADRVARLELELAAARAATGE